MAGPGQQIGQALPCELRQSGGRTAEPGMFPDVQRLFQYRHTVTHLIFLNRVRFRTGL